MVLMDVLQGEWTIDAPNHHGLSGKRGEEAIREWGTIVFNEWNSLCEKALFFVIPGRAGIWTTNEDDKKWFLANLLVGGHLNIKIKKAGSGLNDFEPYYFSSEAKANEIVRSKLWSQSNARKKGPCGNKRVFLLEDETVPIGTPIFKPL